MDQTCVNFINYVWVCFNKPIYADVAYKITYEFKTKEQAIIEVISELLTVD